MQPPYITSAITPRIHNKYDVPIVAYHKSIFDLSASPELDDDYTLIQLNDNDLKVHFDTLADYMCTGPRFVFKGNPDFRQPIVYVILTRTDKDGNVKYFTYDRNSGGEERLDNLYSIGWGGHVDVDDIHHEGQYMTLQLSAMRELEEEIAIITKPAHPLARFHFNQTVRRSLENRIGSDGIIIDNTNTVGREHLGYVTVIDITLWFTLMSEKGYDVELTASDMDNSNTVGWLTHDEVMSGNPENWTRIYLESIDRN